MTTIEKVENNTEKELEVYPGGELINAITRMLDEPTPIQIIFAGDICGDVVFSVKFLDLGLENSLVALSHPFFRTNAFANFLGEILVRNNMDIFADRLVSKINYDTLVKSHIHRNFGLKSKNNEVFLFTFHINLFYNLQNELLSQTINNENSKITPAVVPAKKIKRGEEKESITTYAEGNNIRLAVPKRKEIRRCFEIAIQTLLEHFGVKNMDVCVNDNMFNYEISVSSEGTGK